MFAGTTIGVTIDRSVFFCLLLVCVVVNFGYPICVIGSAGCGVFPLWFVMPCYAHGQVASVVCYAVLCHGRVECLYKKGTLICRGSTRVYPVESFAQNSSTCDIVQSHTVVAVVQYY